MVGGITVPKRLLKKAAVDSAGKLSVSLRLTRDTALTTKYAGDDVYGSSVGYATVYTRVAAGTRFRVRAEYGTSTYSDKVNAKTYGTWRYYTYAK